MINSSKKYIKFWNNKKVLVTGHTGFKGTWLCLILNFFGAKIIGYSLKQKKKSLYNIVNLKNKIYKNYYNNIKDKKKLENVILKNKPKVIFHLAAQPLVYESILNPRNTFETNINGLVNLLDILRKVKFVESVVIVTSDKVYKINKSKKYTETDELGGDDPYSASKACKEIIIHSYLNTYNLKRISSVRSGNVLGGGDFSKKRIVPDIINSINSKRVLNIRNPMSIRPWQHVIEPLMGYIILAQKNFLKKQKKIKNNAWNFGPSQSNFLKVIEIVKKIEKYKKFKYSISKVSTFKETKILKLNSNKSKYYLNWKSKFSINETIKLILDWNDSFIKGLDMGKVCLDQIKRYIEK